MIKWLRHSLLLFLLLLAILLIIGYTYVKDPALWPINAVEVTTQLDKVKPEAVKETVLQYVGDSFFTIKMDAMQQDLQRLPWVQKVNIERIWPDTLKIAITEQTAVLRWQDTGFINDKGELFDPKQAHTLKLPKLSGDEVRYQEVLSVYKQLNTQLAKQGLSIVELDLSPRSAWSGRLSNGMRFNLGQDDVENRLVRFIGVMPTLNLEKPDEMYVGFGKK
ncbi:MAG: cell division protein FtsQ/DivIB [Gammaproteobacteria bacterium]